MIIYSWIIIIEKPPTLDRQSSLHFHIDGKCTCMYQGWGGEGWRWSPVFAVTGVVGTVSYNVLSPIFLFLHQGPVSPARLKVLMVEASDKPQIDIGESMWTLQPASKGSRSKATLQLPAHRVRIIVGTLWIFHELGRASWYIHVLATARPTWEGTL